MKKIISRTENFFWGNEKVLNHPLGNKALKVENEDFVTFEGPVVKITTTNEAASVQVSPSEKLAVTMGYKGFINTKSIFVLEARPGATLILGIKTNDKKVIQKALIENTFEDLLIKIEAKPFTFYNVPAGLVHGLGKNIKMIEVQKPHTTTFRLYDYNRTRNNNPVELKVDEAINSIDLNTTYKLNSATVKQPVYKNSIGSVIYLQTPKMIFAKCLLVDLETENSYIVEEEMVNFNKYLLISL